MPWKTRRDFCTKSHDISFAKYARTKLYLVSVFLKERAVLHRLCRFLLILHRRNYLLFSFAKVTSCSGAASTAFQSEQKVYVTKMRFQRKYFKKRVRECPRTYNLFKWCKYSFSFSTIFGTGLC